MKTFYPNFPKLWNIFTILIISQANLLADNIEKASGAETILITDVYIDSVINRDKDEYYSSFNVNFTVIACSGTHNLRAELSDGIRSFMMTDFTVSAGNPKHIKFVVDDKSYLECAECFLDMQIDLFSCETIVASASGKIVPCLKKVGFEMYDRDSPFHIKSFMLKNIVDNDNDGNPSSADLDVIFDILPGSDPDSAYLQLLYAQNVADIFFPFHSEFFPLSFTDTSFSCKIENIFSMPPSLLLKSKSLPYFEEIRCYDAKFINHGFEKSDEDNIIWINSVTPGESVDLDIDGYSSKKTTLVSVSSYPVAKKVNMIFNVIDSLQDIVIYTDSVNNHLIESSDTNYSFILAGNNLKKRGSFSVILKIENSESGEVKIEGDTIISGLLMESYDDDTIKIENITVTKQKDMDKDGYYSAFDVNFYVKAEQGITLRAVLNDGINDIVEKNIIVDPSKPVSFTINPDTYDLIQCPHCINNYSIKLYKGDSIVNHITSLQDSSLTIKYESLFEDSPFHIKGISYTDFVDNDGDGKYASANMNVTFDVISPCTDCVYLMAVYGGASEYYFPFKTDYFRISPTDTLYTYLINDIDITGGHVQLMSKNYNNLHSYYDMKNLRDFEKNADDNAVSINTITQKEGIDFDGDGYFRKKGFEINVRNHPDTGEVDIEIQLVDQSTLVAVQTFIWDNYRISETDNNSIFCDFFLKQDQVPGNYNIIIKAKNSKSGEEKIPLTTLASDVLLEPSLFDILDAKDVKISDIKDNDADGYMQSNNLHFYLASDSDITVYGRLYYKSTCNDVYSLLDETVPITLKQSETSEILVNIPGHLTLQRCIYDFKMELYNETDINIATINPGDFSELAQQKLEPREQDVVVAGITSNSVSTIKAFPNPFDSELNLHIDKQDNNKRITVTIYSEHGSIVKQDIVESTSGNIKLPLEELMPGIYYLKIQTDEITEHLKVIKN